MVLLLKPVLEFVSMDNPRRIYELFDSFNEQIKDVELEVEGEETIYEYFFYKGERE